MPSNEEEPPADDIEEEPPVNASEEHPPVDRDEEFVNLSKKFITAPYATKKPSDDGVRRAELEVKMRKIVDDTEEPFEVRRIQILEYFLDWKAAAWDIKDEVLEVLADVYLWATDGGFERGWEAIVQSVYGLRADWAKIYKKRRDAARTPTPVRSTSPPGISVEAVRFPEHQRAFCNYMPLQGGSKRKSPGDRSPEADRGTKRHQPLQTQAGAVSEEPRDSRVATSGSMATSTDDSMDVVTDGLGGPEPHPQPNEEVSKEHLHEESGKMWNVMYRSHMVDAL